MARIGVLVVDDSVVIRRLVSSLLNDDPDINVIGTAANGKLALERVEQVRPDVVILDIEMPVMDGLQTLRALRKTHPRLPVIMFSTLTERGGKATFEALSAGASDYVTKPAQLASIGDAIDSVRRDLVPRIKALANAAREKTASSAPAAAPRRLPGASAANRGARPVEVVAIGASTGGPDALSEVVGALPATLRVPVVIVQHMPPLFTRLFAERLDRNSDIPVQEARDGDPLLAGHVVIAPGGRHLTVVRSGPVVTAVLTDEPPENHCRPAVDVLFRSVATAYGGGALACVLTGMGRDGCQGAEHIRDAGGRVLVQDAETSVVWGMPDAVAREGFADEVLPLHDVAPALIDAVALRSARRPAGAGDRR